MWQDIRYALRSIIKNPGSTIIVVFILAISLAATSTVFSVLKAVLLSSLPYKDSNTIVEIWDYKRQNLIFPLEHYKTWGQRLSVFESVGAYQPFLANLTGRAVIGELVSSNLLSIFRIKPLLGRNILPEEDKPGAARVALLSYQAWHEYFSADPNVLNQTIRVNDVLYSIIGVLPKNLRMPDGLPGKVWIPMGVAGASPAGYYTVIARLESGIELQQAEVVIQTLANRIRKEKSFPEYLVKVISVDRVLDLRKTKVRNAYILGQTSAVILLLIACANIAGVMLTRGLTKRKEIAIRSAIGASRTQLIRKTLIESILLSLISGVLSLFFVSWLLNLSRHLMPWDLLAGSDPNQFVLDNGNILFGFLISAVSGFLFGILPSLKLSKIGFIELLKEGVQCDRGAGQTHQSRGLVVTIQLCLALVLMICGALVFKSTLNVLSIDPGFNPAHVWTTEILLPTYKYQEPNQVVDFERALLRGAQEIFGAQQAATTSNLPLQGTSQIVTAEINGQSIGKVAYRIISNYYPQTFKIPLLKGRYFSNQESEPVAMVNQAFVRQYFHNPDAIGTVLKCDTIGSDASFSRQIIGILSDTKFEALDAPSEPEIYVPFEQDPSPWMTLIVRSEFDGKSVVKKMQQIVLNVDKNQPLQEVTSMQAVLSSSQNERSFITIILCGSASIAYILSLLGIYGTISYDTQQRKHEIAVRRALGATELEIKRLVFVRTAKIAAIGVFFGLTVAAIVTRFLADWLFRVSELDPSIFILTSIILIVTTLLATYFPIRRATRLDPMQVLRYQ
jgi:predicted permease